MHGHGELFSRWIFHAPDILFQIAVHFIEAFYKLPRGGVDALLRLAIEALALQERYSLVSACTFLVSPGIFPSL
jgi:hypothetical protein